ncbi:MAG TPA: hypothetical protein VFX98_07700 [Longimicrobiaceae bacterium]|nr:hypothetical protein [Longimicrobiaceae bacterium]
MSAAPRPLRPLRAEQPSAEREARRARRRRALARLGWLLLVLGALASVVWRQGVGRERQLALAELRNELAVARAERLEAANRVQALRSRARIVRVARERLGMHVARDEEIVLLPAPPGAARADSSAAGEAP